ncbi:MAG: hypothetical protein RR536_00990 [Anaerovoracaceae bacterium]
MNMKKNTKSGHYLVEVSIILPVVIVAILSVGYLMKVTSTEEKVMHIISDEIKLSMIGSYSIKKDLVLPFKIESRIKNENTHVDETRIKRFRYLYGNNFNNGLIEIANETVMKSKMPLKLGREFTIQNQILGRGFIGDNERGSPMSFEEMESDGESYIVYIFPQDGKKYHGKNCTFVKAHETQLILDENIKKNYKACALCDSHNLTTGSVVYCFLKYGGVYHKANCTTIEKFTVNIEKFIAIEKGYLPCLKCGGK